MSLQGSVTAGSPLIASLQYRFTFLFWLFSSAQGKYICTGEIHKASPPEDRSLGDVVTVSSSLSIFLPRPCQSKASWALSGVRQRQRQAAGSPPAPAARFFTAGPAPLAGPRGSALTSSASWPSTKRGAGQRRRALLWV